MSVIYMCSLCKQPFSKYEFTNRYITHIKIRSKYDKQDWYVHKRCFDKMAEELNKSLSDAQATASLQEKMDSLEEKIKELEKLIGLIGLIHQPSDTFEDMMTAVYAAPTKPYPENYYNVEVE